MGVRFEGLSEETRSRLVALLGCAVGAWFEDGTGAVLVSDELLESPFRLLRLVPVRGEGCDKCNRTGYKGRVGLYEVMEVGEQLRELILVGASALELRRKAVEDGMLTLRMSGLRKVKEGLTTIEEVARETVK